MNEIPNSSENVVNFPNLSNKSYVENDVISEDLLKEAELYSSDPLEDLLNEFENMSTNISNKDAKSVLAKVVEKMKLPEELLAQEFSKSFELKTKMKILEEVNQRIKYFLDEVELFIPKQKK